MNLEINNKNLSTEIISNKTDMKPLILLILSIIFIPFAYIFIASVFVLQAAKKNITIHGDKLEYKLIFFYVIIGILFSKYKLISSLYGLMILLCLYSYSLVHSTLNSLDFKKIKALLYTLSLIVFIIGIFQYFSPEFSMPSKWIDAEEYQLSRRIYSTFFNPNIFGFYINFIILIVCENLDFKKINLEWILFFTGMLCLYFTFSRTAWISLIVSLAIASIFNRKYLKYAVLISVVIFGMDSILQVGRMNPVKAASDSSFKYRIEIWKACIEIIKDNFITGIGFGTLFKYISQYSDVVKTNIEHSHNLYLQIFTETGIIGFSLFSILLFRTINKLWIQINTSKNNNKWITASAVLAMTLVHGLVDSVFFTPQILLILSIYAGTLSLLDN